MPHLHCTSEARTLSLGPGGRRSCRRWAGLASALVALTACGQDGPAGLNAGPSRTLSIGVGGELALRLQSIGPGEYTVPPQLSSGAIRFLSAALVGPPVPAGETQLFRFRGVAPGTAIITFSHSGSSATIMDTVTVH
jgi:hypothetical protein